MNRNLVALDRQLNYNKKYHIDKYEQYIDYINKHDYNKILEEIQRHEDNSIYEITRKILIAHLDADDTNMNIGEVPRLVPLTWTTETQ